MVIADFQYYRIVPAPLLRRLLVYHARHWAVDCPSLYRSSSSDLSLLAFSTPRLLAFDGNILVYSPGQRSSFRIFLLVNSALGSQTKQSSQIFLNLHETMTDLERAVERVERNRAMV